MDRFEELLSAHRGAVERYVRFRLPASADADDVLQEIWLTAYRRFGQLKNQDAFKAWALSIARNKCADWFRQTAGVREVSLDEVPELSDSRYGAAENSAVRDTLELLEQRDREVLYLYFWEELPQTEIARRLGVPLGTVKSRLYTAKRRFRSKYSCPDPSQRGEFFMKKLPAHLPDYTIVEQSEASFSVKWEELPGWFLIPRLGEKLSWGMYDIPSRKCSHIYDMEVTGKAEVHGIEGVELTAGESAYSEKEESIDRTFVAQLTDTHCRYLAVLRTENGVRRYITFLDDAFLPSWGFGENNCGNEIHLSRKGDIQRTGAAITCEEKPFLLDIVGRYTVTINGKSFDTVCVMDMVMYDGGVISEQFLDRNGRTVLWRRFNRDDWAQERYGKPWSDLLPENERLTVNGRTYVHWYDCITDHIL